MILFLYIVIAIVLLFFCLVSSAKSGNYAFDDKGFNTLLFFVICSIWPVSLFVAAIGIAVFALVKLADWVVIVINGGKL